MHKYEIVNVAKEIVAYKDGSTPYQAVLLHFQESGDLDGPWHVTDLATGSVFIIGQQEIVSLAYYNNNVGEPEEEWVF